MYTNDDLLQYLTNNDIIDLSNVRKEMENMKRQETLSKHTYRIWQGTNGYWYTYLYDDTKPKHRRLVKKQTLQDLESVIIDYYKREEDNPIFRDVFNKWLNNKLSLNEISKGTYDRYTLDYKRYFATNDIDTMHVKNITENYLESFIRQTIADHKLTQKAYSNMRTLIIGVFRHSKKLGYTNISITSFLGDLELSRNVFKHKVKNKETQIYQENEIPIITEYLKSNPTLANLGILLAFQTGIRAGELSALKFSDVHNHSLHIQRTEIKYRDSNNKYVHTIKEFPKSDAGDRYVILTDSAIETINKIRDRNPRSDYMFEVNGKRILANSFNDYLRRVCKKCNIPMKSMHKIRKTYGTTLIDNGVTESLIMEQMGHSDISTTRRFYYYSNKDNDSKRQQIEQAIGI